MLSIKAAEIQRWDQELKSNTLPHKRRQLLSERVQTLHRESEALRRNIDELGRQRLALWNQREDLRKVIQAGHDDYHLEAWNLTYANSRAKISADEYHDQLETVIQASIDAEVAPVSINTMNLHSNWLNQKGWDSIRELNGSEFIVAKKANCQPDYDIPEQLNEDGLVIVIYKAAWCAMPCDIEIEGFKALQKDFPALRIAVMLVYSEDEAGLAEMQRVRGHQNMLDIDLLAGHGKDESGYSRVGMRAFPTTRIYNNKIRASEHQGAFIIQDPEGRLVFDRKRAIAFLNSVFESKVESK